MVKLTAKSFVAQINFAFSAEMSFWQFALEYFSRKKGKEWLPLSVNNLRRATILSVEAFVKITWIKDQDNMAAENSKSKKWLPLEANPTVMAEVRKKSLMVHNCLLDSLTYRNFRSAKIREKKTKSLFLRRCLYQTLIHGRIPNLFPHSPLNPGKQHALIVGHIVSVRFRTKLNPYSILTEYLKTLVPTRQLRNGSHTGNRSWISFLLSLPHSSCASSACPWTSTFMTCTVSMMTFWPWCLRTSSRCSSYSPQAKRYSFLSLGSETFDMEHSTLYVYILFFILFFTSLFQQCSCVCVCMFFTLTLCIIPTPPILSPLLLFHPSTPCSPHSSQGCHVLTDPSIFLPPPLLHFPPLSSDGRRQQKRYKLNSNSIPVLKHIHTYPYIYPSISNHIQPYPTISINIQPYIQPYPTISNQGWVQSLGEISGEVWFTLQTVKNACGTVALLHSVGNNTHRIGLGTDTSHTSYRLSVRMWGLRLGNWGVGGLGGWESGGRADVGEREKMMSAGWNCGIGIVWV